MCSEGVILRDQDGAAQRIKEEALTLLERGPEPLNADEITNLRYRVTDVLDDFTGTVTPGENYLVAARLAEVASELLLGYNHQWTGQGKWLIRALKRFDRDKAQQLITALECFCLQDSKDELIRYAEQALEPVGGRLFEGYKAAGTI